MLFTPLEKLAALLLLLLTVWGAEQAREHHVYNDGVKAESDRREGIDAMNKVAAEKELARLSGLLTEARAQLATARADLEHQWKELQDAQNRNASLQSDLAAGRRSLRAAIRPGTCQAGDLGGTPSGQLDNGSTVTAELDGPVAAGLVGLTGIGDSAIRRLNACITSYNALAKAVNTAGEHIAGQDR